MSVILSFEICQSSSCKTLTFSEETGAYSSTNLNGWGTPNRALGTATAATLIITTPGNIDYTIDLFATGNFPTTNTSFQYTINPTDIGLSSDSKLPDGVYKFSYSVTTVDGTTVIYNQNIQQAFYCQVQCCVYSMFKDLDVQCDCAIDATNKAIQAYLLLKGLIYSANKGDSINFNTELLTLQKICLNNQCSNCK